MYNVPLPSTLLLITAEVPACSCLMPWSGGGKLDTTTIATFTVKYKIKKELNKASSNNDNKCVINGVNASHKQRKVF